jgi:SAM-dependent methyltransferase
MADLMEETLVNLPVNGLVLDVGCFGFSRLRQAEKLGRSDLRHAGVDFIDPENVPEGVNFRRADLNREQIPFEDDRFDIVVASHVVEHVRDPIRLIADCIRVCKPGGKIYIEAPSERSLLLPSMPFKFDGFHSLSFFDDPTHISRPWTPQSLYRLSCYFGCSTVMAKHQISWKIRLLSPLLIPLALLLRDAVRLEKWIWLTVGWSCFALMEKPRDQIGAPKFRYFIPPR